MTLNFLEKTILALLASIWFFFEPIHPLILMVGVFIIVDTIMGLIAAIHNKVEIVSNKLSRLATKLLVYTAVMLLVYMLDLHILSVFWDNMLVTRLTAGMLVFFEAFSIDEKVRAINKGKGLRYYFTRFKKSAKEIKYEIEDFVKDGGQLDYTNKDDNEKDNNDSIGNDATK